MSLPFPDPRRIEAFERGLDLLAPERSSIPAHIIGYGEISAIFTIEGIEGWVFKRLPIFDSVAQAQRYEQQYLSYTNYLKAAGLQLPRDHTYIVPGHPVVLYITQEVLPSEAFAHKRIHALPYKEALKDIESILREILKVYAFNQRHRPEVELSLDGQLSNWAYHREVRLYVDTSTPVFRLHGVEQIDPEPFLRSVPGLFRTIIRRFFLPQVLERYYHPRLIYIDLLANLYKEKKPDLIEPGLRLANELLPAAFPPITRKEIDAYYREDKFIWEFFLRARYLDRWITRNILRRPYPFLLPGRIER